MQHIATIPITKGEPMITITLTNEELQALGALIDVAVKASGIQGAKAAVPLYAKLEAAVAEANAKPEPQETE
jgi:hypothetical protein